MAKRAQQEGSRALACQSPSQSPSQSRGATKLQISIITTVYNIHCIFTPSRHSHNVICLDSKYGVLTSPLPSNTIITFKLPFAHASASFLDPPLDPDPDPVPYISFYRQHSFFSPNTPHQPGYLLFSLQLLLNPQTQSSRIPLP